MAAMTQALYDDFLGKFRTCVATLGNKVADSLQYGYNDQSLINTFNYAMHNYIIFNNYDPQPTKCMHCDESINECDDEETDTADSFNCLTTEQIKIIINHLSSICYACI